MRIKGWAIYTDTEHITFYKKLPAILATASSCQIRRATINIDEDEHTERRWKRRRKSDDFALD